MRSFLVIIISLLSLSVFAQKAEDAVKFDIAEHAFGKVPKGKPVTFEFKFTNPTKKPLIIEDATAECGIGQAGADRARDFGQRHLTWLFTLVTVGQGDLDHGKVQNKKRGMVAALRV